MQAAGGSASLLVKFGTGMQAGHDQLGGGDALFFVDAGGNATTVVEHGDGPVGVQRHVDPIAVSLAVIRQWRCRPPRRPCGGGRCRHRCRR